MLFKVASASVTTSDTGMAAAQPAPANVLAGIESSAYGFRNSAGAWLASYWGYYAQILGIPDTDIPTISYKLYESFATSSKRVATRGMTDEEVETLRALMRRVIDNLAEDTSKLSVLTDVKA